MQQNNKIFITREIEYNMSYKQFIKKVDGKNKGEIMLFALSTCVWCGKVKTLLNNLEVEYGYLDVDLLNKKDQDEIEQEFFKLKTDFSFPKTIINKKVISGFDEQEILGAINGTKRN